MKNFAVLRLLDRFRWLFVRFGVDYQLMRRILQVKLTMDSRRIPTVLSGSVSSKDPDKVEKTEKTNYFARSMLMYFVVGLIMIPFVVMGSSFIFQMSLVFGMLMFMIMTTLISDFSSVLLDIRDKNILYTRPVDRKTVGWAKAVHVAIYLFMITAALAGPALAAGLIRHGLGFGILFAVNTVLSVILMLVLTAMLYLLILKLFDGEKLKDIINYVQIALSVFIAVGYQLIGRAFSFDQLKVAFTPGWWQSAVFPIWYGASFEWVMKGGGSAALISLAVLAWVVPLIALFVYVKLMPAFERNLMKLSEQQAVGRGYRLQAWSDRLARVVCRGREERAYFRFASKMMGSERDFKLKVYPTIGMSLVFPFLIIVNVLRSEGLEAVSSSRLYLTIYMSAILIPSVIMMLKYSGRYKGAWIFKAAPLQDLTPYYRGTLKAFAVRLLLPVYMLLCLAFILLFGWSVIPHLAAVLVGLLLFTVICYLLMSKELPFSVPFEAMRQSDNWKLFPLFLFMGLFAGVHAAASFIPYGVYGYGLLLLILNWMTWKLAFRRKADISLSQDTSRRISG
jgi:ABC-2 type transport system permease protein